MRRRSGKRATAVRNSCFSKSIALARFWSLALLLVSCALPVAASSDPPGDNRPFLVAGDGDGMATVYFSCVDYDPDDEIDQCGRKMHSDDSQDCYFVTLEVEDLAISKRQPIDCSRAWLKVFPINPAQYRILDKHRDEIDFLAITGETSSSIWTLVDQHDLSPALRRYSSQGVREFDIDWDGWSINPSGFTRLDIRDDFVVSVGKLCKGKFKKTGVMEECEGNSSSFRGDFGVLQVNLDDRKARAHVLGEAIGAMLADSTSSPLMHGGAVFVGWVRDGVNGAQLVLSSIDLRTGHYCEKIHMEPLANNFPVDIDLLDTTTGVLAAWSWDGIITVARLDPQKWNDSCGADGVQMTRIDPLWQAGQNP